MAEKQPSTSTSYYFPQRLQKQLAAIPDHPLTLVEAPSGFGKTTAVREYFASMGKGGKGGKGAGRERWYTCLGESPEKVWAGICNLFRELGGPLADALAALGVPARETLPDVATLLRKYRSRKTAYLIIDNYQLFATPVQIALLTALAACRNKNLHLVVITQPLASLPGDAETIQNGEAYHTVTAGDFFFDSASIAKYCRLTGIAIATDEIEHIQSASQGWIAAIRLQLKQYQETGLPPRFVGSSRAISALVETAVWNKLSVQEKAFMLGVSLLDGFTRRQAAIMNGGGAVPKIASDMRAMDFFIRYVADKNAYALHAILRDYLLERFAEQPPEFITTMRRRAAEACLAVGDYLGAARFFMQVADYDAILAIPFTDQYFFNHQEQDIIQFFSRLFQECPPEILRNHPLTVITVGIQFSKKGMREDHAKAVRLVKEFLADPPRVPEEMPERELDRVRGEFEMLLFFPLYNNVAAMGVHQRKAHAYLSRVSSPPRSRIFVGNLPWAMGIPSVMSAYWSRSGGLQDALAEMDECLPFYAELAGGHGAGGDIVMRAESALNRGNSSEAETLCYKTLYVAQNAGQSSNRLCAELILARIGILRGDEKAYHAARKNIADEMERVRQAALTREGEMCLAHLDLLFGKTDGLPDWLRSPEAIRRVLYGVTQPHALMLYCWMLLLEKRRAELYALTETALETARAMHYPLLQVYHLIFLARATLADKGGAAAVAHAREALAIALPDSVYLPFAEHGGALLPFLESLKGEFDGKQIKECLAFCRRWSKGTAALYGMRPDGARPLTPRQEEFLHLAATGESNAHIAVRFGVSPDNVNKILRSAYARLHVRNRTEAMRVFLRSIER